MSGKRKTGKPAAIVLRWNRQVLRHEWRGKTHRTAIIAVAAVLIDHADPGGGEIWPSIETIASKAGVNRNTACTALAELRAAGMLTRHGKRHGAINYRLRLVAVSDEILPNDAPSISDSISDSIRRDTQPPTSERSEEEEEKAPAIGGVNAASAGNTEPPRIEGDEADQIITTFITAFDAKWEARPRGKNIAVTKLEPSRPQLRAALITKHDAGWPIEHLVDRVFASMPDPRHIKYLTNFVADQIERLPAKPDATARKAIEADKVAAEAERRKKEKASAKRKAEKAEADRRESERIIAARRKLSNDYQDQMARIEDALIALHGDSQAEPLIISTLAGLGIANPDADTDDLSDDALRNFTTRLRTKANELQTEAKQKRDQLLDEFEAAEVHCRRAYLDRHRAWHEVESDIDAALAAHGINRDTMRDHGNITTATRLHRELGDKIARLPIPTPEQKASIW